MRAAADREDLTEKNAVTPGPIAPASELLGDMLLEMRQPAQALKEYEATLKKEPKTEQRYCAGEKVQRAVGESVRARRQDWSRRADARSPTMSFA
jgi:hypothetical protein